MRQLFNIPSKRHTTNICRQNAVKITIPSKFLKLSTKFRISTQCLIFLPNSIRVIRAVFSLCWVETIIVVYPSDCWCWWRQWWNVSRICCVLYMLIAHRKQKYACWNEYTGWHHIRFASVRFSPRPTRSVCYLLIFHKINVRCHRIGDLVNDLFIFSMHWVVSLRYCFVLCGCIKRKRSTQMHIIVYIAANKWECNPFFIFNAPA